MADKYHHTVTDSTVTTDINKIKEEVNKILGKATENNTQEVLRFLFSALEHTSLNATDSQQSIARLTERVNDFENEHGDLPSLAAVCVYPNFAQVVRAVLEVTGVRIVCVAGGFPSSQTFSEVKIAETALAIESGADEIDTVLNLGDFLDDDWETVSDDLEEIRHSCRDRRMKVILETGALGTPENIKAASILALYSGADFLKTSTGKGYPGASLEAVYIICKCIKEYVGATGRMVGIKVAGGVSDIENAVNYYTIVKEVLGEKWLTNEYFRIGSSGLANVLYKELTGKTDNFF